MTPEEQKKYEAALEAYNEIKKQKAYKAALDDYRATQVKKEAPKETKSTVVDKLPATETKPKAKEQPSNESIPVSMAKGLAEGVIEITDLPKGIASLAEDGVNYVREFKSDKKNTDAKTEKITDKIPSIAPKIKEGVKKISGVDLEPKPTSAIGRILTEGSKFAGGAVGGSNILRFIKGLNTAHKTGVAKDAVKTVAKKFTESKKQALDKFSNNKISNKIKDYFVSANATKDAKLAKSAFGAGATSGVLKEGGVPEGVAEIAGSIIAPTAAKSYKTATDKVAKAVLPKHAEERLSKKVQKQLGSGGIKEAFAKLTRNEKVKPKIEGVELTTPEVLKDAKLAKLYDKEANSPELIKHLEDNLAAIKSSISKLAPAKTAEEFGKAIREPHSTKLDKLKQQRKKASKNLYEAQAADTKPVNIDKVAELISNKLPVLDHKTAADFKKHYRSLKEHSTSAKTNTPAEKLADELSEIFNHSNNAVKPVGVKAEKLDNTIKAVAGEYDTLLRTGNDRATHYYDLKKALSKDLSQSKLGLKPRDIYRKKSIPINDYEVDPLLEQITYKNPSVTQKAGFKLSSEKIPEEILKAPFNSLETLINRSKGNKKLVKDIKGVHVDDIVTKSSNSKGNLSADKLNKYLTENQDRLKKVLNVKERKTLRSALKIANNKDKIYGDKSKIIDQSLPDPHETKIKDVVTNTFVPNLFKLPVKAYKYAADKYTKPDRDLAIKMLKKPSYLKEILEKYPSYSKKSQPKRAISSINLAPYQSSLVYKDED